MSDDLVKRAREALDGVTPGPWERDMSYQWPSKVRSLDEKHRHRWVVDVPSFPDSTHTLSDARFIAASRELVPEMADRIEELEAKLAKAVDVGLGVGASLAAAISLLERGGKKAAPSDKIFVQMLADYNASMDRFRAALAEINGGGDE